MGQCCSDNSVEKQESNYQFKNQDKDNKQSSLLQAPSIEGQKEVQQAPDANNKHAPKPYSVNPNLPNLPAEAMKSDAMFPPYNPLPPRRQSFITYPNFPILDYNGGVYKGQFKNGKPHGFGIFVDGQKNGYQGWWENGLQRGHGRWVFTNGEIYDGMIEAPTSGSGDSKFGNGVRQGWGMYMDSKREVIYNGNWENNKRSGNGRLDMPNGLSDGNGNTISSFEGSFQNDQKEGEGIQYHKDGSNIKGTWKNGNLDGKIIWTSGDLSDIKQGTYSKGKLVKWN